MTNTFQVNEEAPVTGWDRLRYMWDNLYVFADYHRDGLNARFLLDDYDMYHRASMNYVVERFKRDEQEVEVLRRELTIEERPSIEPHIEILLLAIREHRTKFCNAVAAIDELSRIDEKKWEKTMPAELQFKRVRDGAVR